MNGSQQIVIWPKRLLTHCISVVLTTRKGLAFAVCPRLSLHSSYQRAFSADSPAPPIPVGHVQISTGSDRSAPGL